MPIAFTCPQCGSQTNVDDRFAGHTGPCRTCGATVTIPGTPTQPFAASAPPPPRSSSSSAPVLLIVLGCGGMAVLLGIPIMIALLLPAVQAAREAARRSQCNNNLKQIGLALQSYADVHKTFPPAYFADENGKPMHSWRVLILPYLEQKALYDRYNFDEPWDGPNNRQLAALIPPPYRCPTDPTSGPASTTTNYAAITGPGTMFDGETSANFGTIKDGTSNTLIVVETTAGINWMEPRDLDINQMTFQVNASPKEISSHHPGGAQVVFADGHTNFLRQSMPAHILRALISKAGGEPLTGDF
jgi:prepilin-type processing-associated H-X9-DG protein